MAQGPVRLRPLLLVALVLAAVAVHAYAIYGIAHIALRAGAIGVMLVVVVAVAKHLGAAAALLGPLRRWWRRD